MGSLQLKATVRTQPADVAFKQQPLFQQKKNEKEKVKTNIYFLKFLKLILLPVNYAKQISKKKEYSSIISTLYSLGKWIIN